VRTVSEGDKTMTTRFGIRGLCGAVAAALFLGLAHPALAADQPQWVRQLGTSEYDTASGVATDADGNVYIAGYSGGRFGSDAWVAKYSATGALRWKQQVATADVVVSDVATDGDGNVYIAGYTRGSLGGTRHLGREVFRDGRIALGAAIRNG
jgi:hypothetical protein